MLLVLYIYLQNTLFYVISRSWDGPMEAFNNKKIFKGKNRLCIVFSQRVWQKNTNFSVCRRIRFQNYFWMHIKLFSRCSILDSEKTIKYVRWYNFICWKLKSTINILFSIHNSMMKIHQLFYHSCVFDLKTKSTKKRIELPPKQYNVKSEIRFAWKR